MYLSNYHPWILNIIKKMPGGLLPTIIGGEHFLSIKASKEVLLTAKINKGFRLYLMLEEIEGEIGAVLISAFFDDFDEPLTISTPLIGEQSFTNTFMQLFKQTEFNVCFFDERNIEYLSYKATANFEVFETQINVEKLIKDLENVPTLLTEAEKSFSSRTSADDEKAVDVRLEKPLFPDDLFIMNLDLDSHSFNGAKSFSHTSLAREEPGSYQENDLVFLLQRTFDQNQIYLNPIKERDGNELVDIMVATENYIFLIQAKDSPNTEKTLKANIQRKRTKSINQLKNGASQLKGAINEIKRNPKLPLLCADKPVYIDFKSKKLVGVVIVKELFKDMYGIYSPLVFTLMEEVKVPVVFFDFPEFSRMTLHCNSEAAILNAIFQIIGRAFEFGQFPRLSYSGKPLQD